MLKCRNEILISKRKHLFQPHTLEMLLIIVEHNLRKFYGYTRQDVELGVHGFLFA